eukprot:snap_masked-scaffold_97-processed-gene-0.23-mRNA-1 protein AED:1.00 eAED:1.00 QI:0/-1/0/0/-1/1/1/0/89
MYIDSNKNILHQNADARSVKQKYSPPKYRCISIQKNILNQNIDVYSFKKIFPIKISMQVHSEKKYEKNEKQKKKFNKKNEKKYEKKEKG